MLVASQKSMYIYRPTVRIVGPHLSSEEVEKLRCDSELFVSELAKLIMPSIESPSPTVLTVYVAEHAGPECSPQIESGCDELAISVVMHHITLAALVIPFTRQLAIRWYGEKAAGTGPILEGVAGLAFSRIPGGPSLTECDAWVQSELRLGKTVSPVAQHDEPEPKKSTRKKARESDEAPHGINVAATCFTAFLYATPESLRRYFQEWDPERHDTAALEAYGRPLAVLEEEWINRTRKQIGTADSLFAFLKQIQPLLKPYRWNQLEILFYLLLAAAYNIVQPYAIKVFIDRLTVQLKSGSLTHVGAAAAFSAHLAPFLAVLALIYVVNGLVSLRRAYTVNWLNQNVLNTLQVRMYSHLQRLSHSFYVHARIGDLMARLTDDLDNVQSALSQVTNKALYQLFTVVGALSALIILTHKSLEVAVPILCIVPLFALNYVALRTRNKQASREQRKRVSQAMTTVHQDLQAHALIKAFGMENRMLADYRARILALQSSKIRLALLSAYTDLSEDMTTALAQLVVFGVGGYLVLRDHGAGLGVGDLTALLVLVKSIFSPIASLSGIGQTIQQATGSMERVTELLNEPLTIMDREGAKELPPPEGEIQFENVTFTYDRPVLRGLTLTIPAKSHVAIVGPSGAGKSTILNLLMRFWDADSGRILIDGHDLKDISLSSLRSQIGLVFQETTILDTTLRANIAVGRPEATDAEIEAAAKAAQLDKFIESLPAGYDTIPGENGARLSVGQKQRIAIARVFLRNPPILILDEATSALDAGKEAGILETLAELAVGRTTVSVTHRIAQAASADHIFVINDGQLVEEGRDNDLLAQNGLYSNLFRHSSTAQPTDEIPPLGIPLSTIERVEVALTTNAN